MKGIRKWLDKRNHGKLVRMVSEKGARERVARGAAYLDEVDPVWYFRIDPVTLELNRPDCCILGQLHGDYRAGLFRSDILNGKSMLKANLSPISLGFQAADGVGEDLREEDYANLTHAWREAIGNRIVDNGSVQFSATSGTRTDRVRTLA